MKLKWLWAALLYGAYGFAYFYVMLPPLNWHAPQFWQFLFFTVAPLLVVVIIYAFAKEGSARLSRLHKHMHVVQVEERTGNWKQAGKISTIVLACMILFPLGSALVTSRFFNAKDHAQRIDVKNVDFSEIPEVDFTKTPIIDRDSSVRLGDKVMGNMSELVSQFDVSDEYTQISYRNSVYRVTPLTYNGIIKYFQNREEGIPAYITVDSTSGKTELVKLKDLGLKGMKYVPSGMFNDNLMRHLRFSYPTEIFGSPSFEIDEDGHPWYICSTYTYKGVGTRKKVTGAIFLDPITGESKKYDAGDIPKWADRVYPEATVVEELDDNGSLQDGFLNSVFGQNGVTLTSEGYNYLEKDGDIWLYSGITSANSDESNLGFVLVNLRTHEAMKIKTAGANETSAMESAQSEVKNYGYESTFPLLINVKGNPVYLMSLKDNGIIKMYATVSAIDYQKVATVNSDEGLNELLKETIALLGASSDDVVNKDSLEEAIITVSDIEKLMLDGTTIYYLRDENGAVYKITFSAKYENELVFLTVGKQLKITYMDQEGIKQIRSLQAADVNEGS